MDPGCNPCTLGLLLLVLRPVDLQADMHVQPLPAHVRAARILNGREAGPGPQAAAVMARLKVGQSPSKLDKGPFIRTSVKALSHVR